MDRPSPPTAPPPAGTRPTGERTDAPSWLQRLGVAGFLFFLVKGIAWLVVPGLLVAFGVQC